MIKEVEKIVKILKTNYSNIYDLDVDYENGFITVNGTLYTIHKGMTDSELNDLAYYIAANSDLYEDNNVSESITNASNIVTESDEKKLEKDAVNVGYPALLVALDSEREATVTYETLIEIEKTSESPNPEVISLLEKILVDEREHIALLSALQAKNSGEFVADDAQDDFSGYIEDIKTDINDK